MVIHVIQQGETVWSIARQYGVAPQRIISDNNLINFYSLPVGQALIILIPETVYTVRPGDTLQSVANQHGMTVIALLQNNPYLNFERPLRPGEMLVIRFQGEKQREITVNAYAYPNISQGILTYALPFLTYLSIFSYGFTTEGELIPADDAALIRYTFQYETAPVLVFSSITEEGNFSGEHAKMLFNDLVLQNKVLDQLVIVMLEKGYRGIDLDFEYVDPEDKDAFLGFTNNTVTKMNAQGLFVNTDLAPKVSSVQRGTLYEAHDYATIGSLSNMVLLMTYEWGYTFGPPMAVAPLNRVREVVEYAVTQIPPSKIQMGIPNYGYDWPLPFEEGVTQATSIGNTYATEIATRYGAEIQYDETAQSPYFNYYRNGQQHVVWFEDVRSIQAKYNLLDEYNLLGAGYWNAMRPFAQNWAFVGSQYIIRKIV